MAAMIENFPCKVGQLAVHETGTHFREKRTECVCDKYTDIYLDIFVRYFYKSCISLNKKFALQVLFSYVLIYLNIAYNLHVLSDFHI